jgi:hypothetical protein
MRYQQPPNEDAFEEFCLVLLRRHWNCPSLERFGHRGEQQHGVDLVDLGGGDPLRAAQCKHHAPDQTLPPSEFRGEVEDAKGFQPALGHYAVLTTAKKSADTQKEVILVNKELHLIALIKSEDIARKILTAMHLPTEVPKLHSARPPPTQQAQSDEHRLNWPRRFRTGCHEVDCAS